MQPSVFRHSPVVSFRNASRNLRIFAVVFLVSFFAAAQSDSQHAKLTGPIDEGVRVTLRGNTHPLARPQYDQGLAPDSLPMQRMMLQLSRAPEQETALGQLL